MRRRIAPVWGLCTTVLLAAGAARAATFTVTNTSDAGAGSLRQAIFDANANGGPDLIDFAPGLAGATIAPLSSLPGLSDPGTTIDGDFGADCDPDINLDGLNAGAGGAGLQLHGTGIAVRGLALYRWSNTAVQINGDANTLTCNHIGTDTGGSNALPNVVAPARRGSVDVYSSNSTIGPGNLIANNGSTGVQLRDGDLNAYPDFVGLTSDSAPRVYPGIAFTAPLCGNLSGSGFTPLDGSGRPFADHAGIRLRGRLTVGAAGDYSFDFQGRVDDEARLRIDGGTVANLQGNVAAPVVVNLSAGAHTIEVDGRETEGGGTTLVAFITGPGSVALTTDDQSLCPTGQAGLCAEFFQLRVPKSGNRVTANRMRDNGGLGIQFASCGPHLNDVGDGDVGPNTLLNFPVVTALTSVGGGDFNVTGTAPPNSTVELFTAAPDASGHGEGASLLTSTTATGGGNFAYLGPLPAIGALTATATDAGNNTSEFGKLYGYSTGASGLYAKALSSTSIEISWIDPDLIETGFRVERSINGTAYTPVITLGNEATSHTDTGLTANTLYYYRVIATTTSGDAPASNRATASTWPLTAAKVCYQRLDRSNGFVNASSVAWDGSAWAVAWSERDLARDNIDLLFRRFHATTLAPLGSITTISDADMNVGGFVFLTWNGTHFGLLWNENARGAAGAPQHEPWFFARLDANGQRVGGNLRVPLPVGHFLPTGLHWDGSHWGLVFPLLMGDALTPQTFTDLHLLRLTADGRAAGPPVALTASVDRNEDIASAAWNPIAGHYGVAYRRNRDLDAQWLFQRFSAIGTPVDGAPVELDAGQFDAGANGTAIPMSLIFDGSDWVLAYGKDDPASAVETVVYLRQVSGSTGLPLGSSPTRLSDDALDASLLLRLLPKPGGGYAAFTRTFDQFNQLEVARMQATAAGARDGALAFITPNDGFATFRPSVGGVGPDFLVLYAGGADPSLPAELYAVRVAADGLSPPLPPVAITSGHDPTGSSVPIPLATAPVGAGFAALWADGLPAAPRLNLRLWDGNGQVVSTLAPLTATPVRLTAADLAGVGNSVGVAWKTPSNDVIFARYNASGGSITGEKTLASAVGGQPRLALRWNGEHFGVFYHAPGGARYQRVDEAGNAVGATVVLPRNLDNRTQVEWLGEGWALVTAGAAPGTIDYLRFAADGSGLDGPLAVATMANATRSAFNHSLHYNGRDLGLSYANWLGLDPPSEDIFFTVLHRNGSLAFAPVTAVGTALTEITSSLYSVGSEFRLIPNGYGLASGLAELPITPLGVVSPPLRFHGHRGIGVNRLAYAYNGRTLALLNFPSGQQHLYFHTDACLADATPPPCPTLSAMQSGSTVQTSWNAVSDAESGVIRYVLYRDGSPLAENDADVLSYVDGFDASVANVYQVRALNGAFVESASCPTVALSPLIFRDGFE